MGSSDSKPEKENASQRQAVPNPTPDVNRVQSSVNINYYSQPASYNRIPTNCRPNSSVPSHSLPLCTVCKTRHGTSVQCVSYTVNSQPSPSTNVSSPAARFHSTDDFVHVSNLSQAELCPRCVTKHSPFQECTTVRSSFPDNPVKTNPVKLVPIVPVVKLCENKAFGCTEHYSYEHVVSCMYKKTICPIRKYLNNCTWEGAQCNLVFHVNTAHPNNIIYKLDTENKKNNFAEDKEDWDIHLIQHEEKMFLFFMKITHPWFYMAAQLLGTEEEAKTWTYKINLYTKNKKGKSVALTEACTSYNNNVADVFASGNCGAVPLHIIRNYVTNSTQLTFKLKISKYVKKQNPNPRQNKNRRN